MLQRKASVINHELHADHYPQPNKPGYPIITVYQSLYIIFLGYVQSQILLLVYELLRVRVLYNHIFITMFAFVHISSVTLNQCLPIRWEPSYIQVLADFRGSPCMQWHWQDWSETLCTLYMEWKCSYHMLCDVFISLQAGWNWTANTLAVSLCLCPDGWRSAQAGEQLTVTSFTNTHSIM